ncbi:MAG: hypothetical protein Q8O53_00530 [Candidatus Moranbacteria bacterium]|nr:hypothetical protein [Candidatus Moranbacteria bacterium]
MKESMEVLPTTEMEVVFFHLRQLKSLRPIEIPAEEGKPAEKIDTRAWYIQQAREALAKMTNPEAKKMLEQKIAQYENRLD